MSVLEDGMYGRVVDSRRSCRVVESVQREMGRVAGGCEMFDDGEVVMATGHEQLAATVGARCDW